MRSGETSARSPTSGLSFEILRRSNHLHYYRTWAKCKVCGHLFSPRRGPPRGAAERPARPGASRAGLIEVGGGRDGARDAAPAADGRRLERRESLLRGRKRVGGLGGTNSMREARDSCGDERQAGRGRRARRRRWGRSAARSDGLRRENLDRRSRRAGRARAARGRRENEKLPCARRCREKRGVAPVRRGAPGFRLGSDGAAEVSPAQRRRSRRVLTSLRIVVQLF